MIRNQSLNRYISFFISGLLVLQNMFEKEIHPGILTEINYVLKIATSKKLFPESWLYIDNISI